MAAMIDDAPIVTGGADAIDWDETADVVVVGFGGAGVVAALEAREKGADVIAVDRFGGGGATAYSGGINYAGGTRHQKAAGFDDTAEEMFKYLTAEGTPVAPSTLRHYCESANANLEWLEGNGVPYGSRVYEGKVAFPPDGYWLYFSGNEKIPAFKAKARPAPRGHRPVGPGFGGSHHYARLKASALTKGVRLLTHAPARRLIIDKDGVVIGIEVAALPERLWKMHDALYAVASPMKVLNEARKERAIEECRHLESEHATPRRIRARKGVILSAGGFVNNLEMLRQHRPALGRNYTGLLRLGSMGCDGSGIKLGQSVGGKADLMSNMYLGSPLSPPEEFVRGLIVNKEGKRFINEDAYQALIGEALTHQSDEGTAVLILDRAQFWRGIRQSFFPGKGMFLLWGAPALFNVIFGGTRRARRLDVLARKCGVAPDSLERTVAEWNALAIAGSPDPFGKAPDKVTPLTKAPYYAVNISLKNRFGPTMAFTLGGLLVDETTGAVRGEKGIINGLYAAGRTAVGLCSQGYISGLSIADTVFSGRRAGRHAAGRSSQER